MASYLRGDRISFPLFIGQPVLSVYRSASLHPILNLPGFDNYGADAIPILLFSFVSWGLYLSTLLVAVNVLLLGLALLLFVATPRSPSPAGPLNPAYRAFAVLAFGTLIVGTGGTIDGYAAPIPFGLSLLVGFGVLSWRSIVVRRHIVLSAPSDFPVRKDVLERSVALLALSRREQDAYDKLGKGDLDYAGYKVERRIIELHRNKLLDLHALAREAPRRPATQGELEAISFGIGFGTGACGRVSALRPAGWLVVAIPAALSAYFVIKDHSAAAVLTSDSFGIALLAFSILSGSALWLAAAVLLASVFPRYQALMESPRAYW
ncbi:MAG: hypothetical protein ACLP0J_10685 [Solirubrobacteraceae bacterium]